MLSGLHFFAPCVAAAGGIGDIALPIIVFIVIAVRLMQAAGTFTKNRPGGVKPQANAESSSSPEESLRDFMESLSGESKQAPKPLTEYAPQSAPPPVPPATFIITRHTPAKPAPIVALPVPDELVSVPIKITVPQQAVRPAGSGRKLADVVGRLRGRHLLREAIILREVLGPPLGQRPRPPIA